MDKTAVKNVFFFDAMLTPKIITFICWLMLLAAVGAGIAVMQMPFYGGFFKGLIVMLGAAVLSRIWCELLIVLFKIHDSARQLAGNAATTPAQPPRADRDSIHPEFSA